MAELRRAAPRLIVFSDTTRAAPETLVERFQSLGEAALPNRVLFVLRDYELELGARVRLAAQLSGVAKHSVQAFGVAERADLGLAFGCDALHLPGTGLSAPDARALLGDSVFLSRGSHDPELRAEPELDAVLLSPIFAPRKGRAALGLGALSRARQGLHAGCALYALGGVGADNAGSCLESGATGVALIDAALAPDPRPLLSALGILRH